MKFSPWAWMHIVLLEVFEDNGLFRSGRVAKSSMLRQCAKNDQLGPSPQIELLLTFQLLFYR